MRVLVTGANRGLGLEFVRQLLERGDQVFATCRNPDDAEALQALQQQGLHIIALDVSNPTSIDASYEAVRQQTDTLDVLINNAGISPGGESFGELEFDTMMATFATNAVGPMLMMERYIDLLRAGDNPKIINLTTGISSLTNSDQQGLYTYRASKTALNMYTRVFRHDAAAMGIVVIVMDPGWVKTDMGGPNAWITPEESISGMLKVIDSLTMEQSGRFWHYSGSEIPW